MQSQSTGLEVAVIGVSGRFPGSKNLDDFWENLVNGVELTSVFTDSASDKTIKAGAVLDDVELFDAEFFGYNPREAETMDPQHRMFLECAWEALENAGYNSEAETRPIGVYAGVGMGTYLLYNLSPNQELMESRGFLPTLIGVDKDYLPTRVSYKLNLTGPSVSVGTACSSSLVAVHLACQSLLSGECDMSLAAGVAVKVPQSEVTLSPNEIAAADGHCRAFDAKASGTIGGNGIGVVVLKRLEDAIADRDRIYAVIKGSAINNDGATKVGYTAPSESGQTRAIRAAQIMAEVEPETITYLEAHGTGTPLGDPIEVAAMTEAFRASNSKKGYCAIGSVKTNVGHLDAAAGITGLIKTVLSLDRQLLPPSINFESPNSEIDFANSPFYVNTELSEWKTNGTLRRAGVSSFGFGGTNAHVVLEEAPVAEESSPSRTRQLLLLSAKTSSALETATTNLVDHLKVNPQLNLADVAYTLQIGRQSFNHRRLVLATDIEDALQALESEPQRVLTSSTESSDHPIVFMFTGQGAQYVNMARELYQSEATFAQQVDLCCDLLQPQLKLDLRQLLYPTAAEAETATKQLQQTAITQPALFVIEYALAKLWMSWGVHPVAMIGHSIGEYVAATLAGVFSLEDALALVTARGQLMQQLPSGSMLSVALSEQEVQPYLGSELSVAVINGLESCVISGATEAIEALQNQLVTLDVDCRLLHTSHAFHSPMMEPILAPFKERVAQVSLKSPQIPYLSNITGTWITNQEVTSAEYWLNHIRQTVRFEQGLQELLKKPTQVLLEVGPGRTLSKLAQRHQQKQPEQIVLTSIRHPREQQSDVEFLLKTLGQLWLAGVQIDWSGFYADEQRHRLPLPTYPFERQRYWIEAPQSGENNHITPVSLGKKPDIADWFYIPCWKQSVPPVPIKQEQLTARSSCTLVFMDECGLCTQLVKQLQTQKQEVVTVQVGTEFAQLSESLYSLNPGQSDDYDTLFEELLAQQKLPEQIVHVWSVTPVNDAESGLAGVEKAQETGFYSLLFLAQAIGKQNLSKELKITVVSNNMQSVTGEEVLSPEKATILGLVKVIPQEYPNLTCRSIDIVLTHSESWKREKLIEQLLTELRVPSSQQVIAYRGNNLWLQTFEPVRLDESLEETPRLREEGIYLITGGLGGIGLVLAKHLAKTVRAKLILTGRSAFPAREEWQNWLLTQDETNSISRKIGKVQELEALGAEVLVISADIANIAQMTDVIAHIEEKFGQLNGVIHAAGIVGEKSLGSIEQTNKRDCEQQFQTKIYGLLILEKVLQGKELDFCLLSSSLSSVLGGLEYAAYAAANLFMDAFAYQHNQTKPIPWLSVNWDVWQVEKQEQKTRFNLASLAEFAIRPEEGVKAFQRILSRAQFYNQTVVSTGDLQLKLKQWINPESTGERAAEQKLSLHSRPDLQSAYVAPRNEIEQKIVDIWQQVLGIELVGIHDNFFELGGDSLNAITFTNQFQKRLGQIVHVSAVFEAPTIAELATYFQKEYPEVVTKIHGIEANQTRIALTEKVNATRIAQLRQLMPPLLERQKTDTTKNQPAIFILSPPRTGSTLLRVILGGHPQLFAPPELNLLSFDTLSERKAAFSESEKFMLEGTIRALKQIKNCSTQEAKRLMQEFEDQQLSTKEFYALMQQCLGDKILVDKSPSYTFNLDVLKRIEAEFENALYIHILRHPYGMIHSFEEAKLDVLMGFIGGSSLSRKEIAELIWLISNQNILEFFKHVPEHRQYCVKFEDLVSQPQTIVKSICQFLELDFHPEMLQPYKEKNQRMTDGLYSVSRMIGDPKFHQHKGIDIEVANRWKHDYAIDFLGDVTWQVADLFGYKQMIEMMEDREEGEL
ncbi:MAG: SDR family oxidoreductase [Cyanobacteria bacterium P01_G01_bin.67]